MTGSNRFEGGEGSLQRVVGLGTGAVVTQTVIVGVIPKNARVTAIRFHGQSAVTATSLTAECFARTTAGGTGLTLQDSATNIAFASAAAAKAGVAGTIAGEPNVRPGENQLIEAVLTADTCSVGPGDLAIEVQYEPRI